MIGMYFLRMYEKNPKDAIALVVLSVAVVAIYFLGLIYSKHREKQRAAQEKNLGKQLKQGII